MRVSQEMQFCGIESRSWEGYTNPTGRVVQPGRAVTVALSLSTDSLPEAFQVPDQWIEAFQGFSIGDSIHCTVDTAGRFGRPELVSIQPRLAGSVKESKTA